jgi:hypothetical protein
MSVSHLNAPTRFIEVDGDRFAYRRWGKSSGAPPLFFIQHFRGGMDHWDPVITDGLAEGREVILFDARGISASSGGPRNRIEEMADDIAAESLGADIVIDYKNQAFESLLRDYDVVLNSQDKVTLEKSLKILKQGGKLISISGPPDPRFAREQGSSWMIEQVLWVLSSSIRWKARRRSVNYSFLFMRANGAQLSEITSLIDAGVIRPVMDRVFPFASTNEAIAYVEAGRAKGKVVVKVR